MICPRLGAPFAVHWSHVLTLDSVRRRSAGIGAASRPATPTRAPTLATRASRPTPGDTRDTESTRVPLCEITLHDAEGTEIRFWSRVEQVAVDKAGGAAPDRLGQQGEVIGRSAHMVYVRFDHGSQTPIPLRPHLVRVLDTLAGKGR